MFGSHILEDLDQTLGLLSGDVWDFRGAYELRVGNTHFARDPSRQPYGEIRQKGIPTLINGIKPRSVGGEVRRLFVREGERLEVILRPRFRPVHPHLINRNSLCDALAMNWNREPLFALRSLDLITIAPAMFIILHVIVKDEQIRAA